MEALLARIEASAAEASGPKKSSHSVGAFRGGAAAAYLDAAKMLREALAAEAPTFCENCNHAPHVAHCCEGRNRVVGLSRGCECQTDSGAP